MVQDKLIGLCSDHAGYDLKEHLKQLLEARGYAVRDFGCPSAERCDYPDFAHPAHVYCLAYPQYGDR